MFPTFDMFCQVMDQCTENYECLVIDNNAKSNHLVDQVFWYKAPERPNFKCGAKEFWEYSDKNFKKNSNSDDVTSTRVKNRVEVVKHS